MNDKHIRVCLTGCMMLLLTLCAGPFSPPAPEAQAAGITKIALLASEHAGKVTAALGEQVELISLVNRSLGAGESIAIVNVGKKGLLNLCVDNACIAGDSSEKARADFYRAILLGGQGGKHVVAKSNLVRVEWKKLEIVVKVTDLAGSLKM